MITYEIKKSIDDIEFIVSTNEDHSESWIPKDEANSDYQAYLESLEK